MLLKDIKKGESFLINHIASNELSIQLLRFGITSGSIASCFEKLPFGPLIVKYGHQQVAIGHKFLKDINVTKL